TQLSPYLSPIPSCSDSLVRHVVPRLDLDVATPAKVLRTGPPGWYHVSNVVELLVDHVLVCSLATLTRKPEEIGQRFHLPYGGSEKGCRCTIVTGVSAYP